MSILEEAVMPLPCPFCGGEPYIRRWSNASRIECPDRSCFGPVTGAYGDEADAITAWNRRAGIPATGSGETRMPHSGMTAGEAAAFIDEQAALASFTEYFARNYPGPQTIIGNPNWHAPKIFRAALYAIRQAANPAETQAGDVGRDGVGNDNDGREDSQP